MYFGLDLQNDLQSFQGMVWRCYSNVVALKLNGLNKLREHVNSKDMNRLQHFHIVSSLSFSST